MSNAIPEGAWAASICVLVYSSICLASSVLLAYMLITHGDRTSYISLIAVVVSVSTLASIAQQIYYACKWRQVRETALQQAKLSIDTPTIGYTPLSSGINLALYEVQYYCYIVDSVLIFFWAVALTKGVYQLRFRILFGWEPFMTTSAKIFAIIAPAILVGLSFVGPVVRSEAAWLVVNDVLLLGSLALGSICLLLILTRYITSRHLFASLHSPTSNTTHTTHTTSTSAPSSNAAAKIPVDRILLLRFTIAFTILSAFELSLLLFQFSRYHNARLLSSQNHPDLGVNSTVSEILEFMPGVSASLLAFLLFGTTAGFVQRYRDFFACLFGQRRRGVRGRRQSLERAERRDGIWESIDYHRDGGVGYRYTIQAGLQGEQVELQGPDPGVGRVGRKGTMGTSVGVRALGDRSGGWR